jgi:hypothetical protein
MRPTFLRDLHFILLFKCEKMCFFIVQWTHETMVSKLAPKELLSLYDKFFFLRKSIRIAFPKIFLTSKLFS